MSEEQVAILRWPRLMEDDGRVFFVKACSRKDASEWIAAQAHEYFKPHDYFTLDHNGFGADGRCLRLEKTP